MIVLQENIEVNVRSKKIKKTNTESIDMSNFKAQKNFTWGEFFSDIFDVLLMVLLGALGTMWLFESLNEVWSNVPPLSFGTSFGLFIAVAIILGAVVRLSVINVKNNS